MYRALVTRSIANPFKCAPGDKVAPGRGEARQGVDPVSQAYAQPLRGTRARTRWVWGLCALAWLATSTPARAGAVYKFIDAAGVVHFTDAPLDDARFDRVETARYEGLAIAPPARVRVPTERDYDRLIARVAGQHGVHPALVKAVIAAESNFKPDAVSHAGAQGMMQLMPATAADLGVSRPFGVVENIDGGVRYLRAMLERYGDVRRALAAYNAGPGTVDRYGGIPPYRETRTYVKRVLEYYRGYWSHFERVTRTATARRADNPHSAVRSDAQGIGSNTPGSPPASARSSVRHGPTGGR